MKNKFGDYKIVIVITLIYALCSLISSLMNFFSETTTETLEGVFMSGIATVTSIYIYLKFKELLNKAYQYHEINNIINLLIIFNVLFFILEILMYGEKLNFNKFEESNIGLVILVIGIAVIYGIIGIIYGSSIKKFKNNSNFKIYGNLVIVASVLMITVIGALFGFILYAISYFYLAMIFNEGNVCGDKLFEKNENKENENLKNNLNNEKNITKKIADDYEKIKEEQNRIKAPKSKMEAEIYFNSLSLNDYQKIKSEATKYLPEGLSEEELKNVIIDQIIRKYI